MLKKIIFAVAILSISGLLQAADLSMGNTDGESFSRGMESFELANRMLHLGLEHKEPIFLLSTIKLLDKFSPVIHMKSGISSSSIELLTDKKKLLDLVMTYASDQPLILQYADNIAKSLATRGTGTPIHGTLLRLPSRSSHSIDLEFRGKEPANVFGLLNTLRIDARSIRIEVLDHVKKEVSFLPAPEDSLLLRWIPEETGTFTINISNPGDYESEIVLFHN